MSFNSILRYGIFSQGGVVAARPDGYISMNSASIIQNTADNFFNPYTWDGTNQPINLMFWMKINIAETIIYTYHFGRETSSGNRNYGAYLWNSTNRHTMTDNIGSLENNWVSPNVEKEKWYFFACMGTKAGGGDKRIYIFDENNFISSASSTTYGLNNHSNLPFQINSKRSTESAYSGSYNAIGFWSGVTSGSFVEEIWNSGNGLSYSNLTDTQKTNLIEWWDGDDWDGTYIYPTHTSLNNNRMKRNTNGSTNISKLYR